MIFLHIGLPKTGTTFLQKKIFPQIAEIKNFLYYEENNSLKKNIDEHVERIYCGDEIKKISLPDKIIISNENLVCDFPSFSRLEEYAEKNLIAFGKNCKILITIRNPIEYLSSVYNQALKSHIVSPENFFLEDKVYFKNYKNIHFQIQNYNISKIYDLYKKKFNEVYIVKFENIKNEENWSKVFDFEKKLFVIPNENLKKKDINKGFSKKSVSILLLFQKILNKIGYSLNSTRYEEKLINIRRAKLNNENKKFISDKKLTKKIIDKILNNLNIRNLLKNRLDGVFFKEKFILDFNRLKFINLEKLIEDYKKIDKEINNDKS